MMINRFLTGLLLCCLVHLLPAQQIADTTYTPAIAHPAYKKGKGPVVMIDQAHYNFHTRTGRYLPFARLLERDGYVVQDYNGRFRKIDLDQGKILVISNALNSLNAQNWFLPTPSAFSLPEIDAIINWVKAGGSLFLIADHMPMAGAAMDLAAKFGFQFTNGFVIDTSTDDPSYFQLRDSSLVESVITRGRDVGEQVDHVVTFTGQGFRIPKTATPVLVFDDRYINYLADTAWVFGPKTPIMKMKGWCQGAFMPYGSGRIAVFGEAAMFTAQLSGPNRRKVGMNADRASQNFQLLLNIVHWLDGTLP